jgi:hypothetical protein
MADLFSVPELTQSNGRGRRRMEPENANIP